MGRRSTEANEGLLAVDYSAFVPILVEGMNEQGRKLNALTDQVLKLEESDRDSHVHNTALREGMVPPDLSQGLRQDSPSPSSSRNDAMYVRQFDNQILGGEGDNQIPGGEREMWGGQEFECRSRITLLELEMQKIQTEVEALRQLLQIAGIASHD